LIPSTIIDSIETVEITESSVLNKKILYAPMLISKLGQTELKRGLGLFLDDAINSNVPGVYMQRRTVSAGQQFNIRGYGNGARGTNGISSNFDGQGTKVYLNGIPITDAEGITLMDDIDFNSVGKVEVLKGPSGTLYGLAIAGVVNLKSITAEKNKVSIGQDYLAGSYGLKRLTTQIRIGGEKSSFLVNYGKQNFDGYMNHTASTKEFVNVIGEIKVSDKQSLYTYMGYSNSYDERNGELTKGQYDTMDYVKNSNNTGNPAYLKNNAHSNVISIRSGISQTLKLTNKISNTTSIFGSGLNSNVSSAGGWTDKAPVNYGLRSTFELNHSFSDLIKIKGNMGIEAQRQNAQIIGYGMVTDSFNKNGYNIIGAMRSNQYTVSKTSSYFAEFTLSLPKDFSLTAGIGVSNMILELNDRFYVASNNNPSNPKGTKNPWNYSASYNGLTSPHLAINKVINKSISLFSSYGVGYKAPVTSYFYIPLTGQVNSTLKPEKGTQIEFGSKGHVLKSKLYYEVAYFIANYSDKMTVVAVPTASGVATAYTYVANGGTVNNKGLELLIKGVAFESKSGFFKSIQPFANLTQSNFKYGSFKFQQLNSKKDAVVEVDYSNKIVPGVPKIVYNLGVDILTKSGFYGNVNYNHRDSMYYTSDNTKTAKGYNILNSKIGFRRTLGGHLEFDGYFGANNITSQQYYYMVFVNQTPDVYLPAPNKINYFGGVNVRYTF
jgi:iron complex outermembrane receptor protein